MKKIVLVCVCFVMMSGVLLGQAALAGKWEATLPAAAGRGSVSGEPAVIRVMLDFKVIGSKVTGSVTVQGREPVELEGKTQGDTVEVGFSSPDGKRKITLNGKISGDRIDFVRGVTGEGASANGIFAGSTGPKEFKASRGK